MHGSRVHLQQKTTDFYVFIRTLAFQDARSDTRLLNLSYCVKNLKS